MKTTAPVILASLTIPKNDPNFAAAIANCKPGEKVTFEATVTSNDDAGLATDINSVTPEYAEEAPAKSMPKMSATDYAKKMRRERMGKMSPAMA